MTLVGPVSASGPFKLRGSVIRSTDVTYLTRASAEEAASVFRDHRMDVEVESVGGPKFPTPWRAEDGSVYAENGERIAVVLFSVSPDDKDDLAHLIVEAVNEKYGSRPAADEGGPTPATLRDFVDRDGDRWFEVRPGWVVMSPTREIAESEYEECGPGYGRNLDEVRDGYGPLREVSPAPLRKAVDRDGDTWFEVEPDRFICRSSRESAREWFHRRMEAEGVRVGLTAEGLADRHGPLREVSPTTSTYSSPDALPSDTVAFRDARGREAVRLGDGWWFVGGKDPVSNETDRQMFRDRRSRGVSGHDAHNAVAPLTPIPWPSYMESPAPLRKAVDCDGDNWFEVEPGRFVLGADRATAMHKVRHLDDVGCSEQSLVDAYGPVTFAFE